MDAQEMDRKIKTIRPAGRVVGDSDRVLIRLEMPGVSRNNLEIKVESNELKIVGHREPADKAAEYLLRERRDGDYSQVYTLDDTIDRNRIDAQLAQGVLTVTLPIKESEKPRLIKVKSE